LRTYAHNSSEMENKQVDESARKSFCVAPVQHPNCLESAYLQAVKICKIIMLTNPEDSRIFGVFVSRDFEVVCRDYGDHDGRDHIKASGRVGACLDANENIISAFI